MMASLLALLRGDENEISRVFGIRGWRYAVILIVIIFASSGIYGATVGLWRSSEQALYTSIKIPALILLTCGGNAVLNGMLAQLLGSALSFRQNWTAILLSFAAASVILCAFAPIALFVLFNTPALAAANALTGHSVMLLTHVFLIAYAGVLGNRLLLCLLKRLNSDAIARRVLLSWLGGNLLLGSQIAWILRPFIGSPNLAVQFLRPDPLRGNFYEAVWRAFTHLLSQH